MFTTYGTNQAISGQTHSHVRGRLFKPSATRRGLIVCPGNNGTSLSYLTDAVYSSIIPALADAGYTMASLPHGTNFANSTAQGYVGDIRTYGQTNWGFASGKVDLIGSSAGGALALNWAKANPTLVNKIALTIPAVDLQDIDENDRSSLSAAIQTAWGGAVPDASNPADNTASFTGFPIKIWYSTSDTTCIASLTTTFGEAVGAEMVSLGAVGHALTGIDPQAMVSFFNA